MFFFRRIKNLWELSRFRISHFDSQLVITLKDGKLVYAYPKEGKVIDEVADFGEKEFKKMVKIIKRNKVDPIDEILKHE